MGGKVDYYTECKLGDRVGWRKGGSWLNNYEDLTFNKQAPKGHLPSSLIRCGIDEMFVVGCEVERVGVLGGALLFSSYLASRAVSCNL